MKNITPKELHQRITAEGADVVLLVDVREDDEFEVCALADALHIPMNQIPLRQDELPDEQDIVVYCHHGVRSQHVIAYLIDAGFDEERLFSLSGGIDAWAIDIDPKMARY